MLESCNQIIDNLLEKIQKKDQIIELYERWIKTSNINGGIAEFISNNKFKRVAIYGMSSLGRSLYTELRKHGIEIAYVIDRRKNVLCEGCTVYTLQDDLPNVDLIIVTAITYYDEIASMLGERIDCALLSLEDIVP